MARRIRGCLAGRLVEITTRTLHGRFLLKPSPETNASIKGVLGRAQRRTGMKVCAVVFLSNHYHLLVVPDSSYQLAQFMEFVNSNIARQLGRLHGWREKFWSRRYQAIPASDEEAAQTARLEYVLRHGVKEGLVDSPEEWPGVHCVPELERGGGSLHGIWHERTAEYRQRGRTDTDPRNFITRETLELSPIPAWEGSPRDVRSDFVRRLVRRIRREAKRERQERGASSIGPDAILRQNPHDRPSRSRRTPAPPVHAASRQARLDMIDLFRAFVHAYMEASARWREGLTAHFPAGAFPPARPWVPEPRANPP